MSTIIRSSLKLSSMKIGVLIIGFVFSFLVIRLFGPSEYGILRFVISIQFIFEAFLTFCIPAALNRFVIEYENDYKVLLRTVLTFMIILNGMAICIFYFFVITSFGITIFFERPLLLVFFIASALSASYLESLKSSLLGLQKFLESGFLEFLRIFISNSLGLAFLYIGMKSEGYLLAMTLGGLSALFLSIFYLRNNITSSKAFFDFEALIKTLRYSMPLGFAYVLSVISTNIGIILLFFFRSSYDVGILNSVLFLGNVFTGVIFTQILDVVFPTFTKSYSKGNLEEYRTYYFFLRRYFMYISCFFAVLLISLNKVIIPIFLGIAYAESSQLIIILLPFMTLRSYSHTTAMVLRATDMTYSVLKFNVFYTPIIILLNVVFTLFFGTWGVAAALIIHSALTQLYFERLFRKQLNLKSPYLDIFKALVLSTILLGLYFIGSLILSGFLHTIAAIIISLAYFPMLILVKGIREIDLHILEEILKEFKIGQLKTEKIINIIQRLI